MRLVRNKTSTRDNQMLLHFSFTKDLGQIRTLKKITCFGNKVWNKVTRTNQKLHKFIERTGEGLHCRN